MKIIKFKQEFLESIRDGSKTQTMRMSSSRIDVQENDNVIALFPNGEELTLKINKVGYKAFKSITDADAKREGFNDKEEFYMWVINGNGNGKRNGNCWKMH